MWFTQNEVVNGFNLVWIGMMFAAWIAVLSLYYRGDWRLQSDPARENSRLFIKGACMTLLAIWLHRTYWFLFLVAHENGAFKDIVGEFYRFRWATPIIVSIGVLGCAMMMFPLLRRIRFVDWKCAVALLVAVLWSLGVWLT